MISGVTTESGFTSTFGSEIGPEAVKWVASTPSLSRPVSRCYTSASFRGRKYAGDATLELDTISIAPLIGGRNYSRRPLRGTPGRSRSIGLSSLFLSPPAHVRTTQRIDPTT